MSQQLFDFVRNPSVEQLELFGIEEDNRLKRLNYALRISYGINGWRPYKLDSITECVKYFKVSHEQVWREWHKLIQNEASR